MDICHIKTPLGITTIQGDENGISHISVSDEPPISPLPSIPPSLQAAATQLQEYFENTRQNFNLKLNPKGTPFQQKVWQELLQIPYGRTCSYMDIAKKLGDPKSIRAAATANGKNPLWIVIPCHRVIGSNGSLTGYAGGLWRKKWLLNHENPINQGELF